MSRITVDPAAFARARQQVMRAVSREPKEHALQLVRLETSAASLRMVSTDKLRLVVTEVPGEGPTRATSALVAAAALEQLSITDEPMAVTIKAKEVLVTTAGGTQRLERVPGEFPPYERYLAADPDVRDLVVERDALVAAIEDLPDDEPLRLRLERGRLELGEVVAISVPATYDGDVVRLFVNAVFLHDAVAAAVGPQIAIQAASPVSPLVIRSFGDESYTALIMPMRSGPGGPRQR